MALCAFRGLLALPFLELLLQLRGLGKLLVEDGGCDGTPKALALIGQLGGLRRHDFGDREEGVQVDQNLRFLDIRVSYTSYNTMLCVFEFIDTFEPGSV